MQLYLAYNSISLVEIIFLLNIYNTSNGFLEYHYANRPSKYNPKVYLGTQITQGFQCYQDAERGGVVTPTTPSWPESLLKKYSSP